jgi:hypothetical protein
MRRELFMPSAEGEARLLLLIDAFSTDGHSLEGRLKLAKLDFFLRYPAYLTKALQIRGSRPYAMRLEKGCAAIENRMIRFRYGPWDPAYYGLLGRLVGKGLVETIPIKRGLGFRTTAKGRIAANALRAADAWGPTADRCQVLKRYLNLTGSSLKNLIYENFPEIVSARVGQPL